MNNLPIMTIATLLLMACAAPTPTERNGKFVFITKASFESDMDGLSGDDAKCQAEANAPESRVPAGTYLPWLSDGTDSPDTRFIKSSHPYLLADGTKIAENYTDLTDGNILHPINAYANGAPVLGEQRFWSDTLPDGKALQPFAANAQQNSCGAWHGSAVIRASTTMGSTARTSGEWSNRGGTFCKYHGRESYRLACFQQ